MGSLNVPESISSLTFFKGGEFDFTCQVRGWVPMDPMGDAANS